MLIEVSASHEGRIVGASQLIKRPISCVFGPEQKRGPGQTSGSLTTVLAAQHLGATQTVRPGSPINRLGDD